MSIKALQEYTRFAKYARHISEENRRETWDEQVDRVFDMHEKKFGHDTISLLQEDFNHAKKMLKQKRVLGSQRALQFGGDPILKKNPRMYNCTSSYVDRPRFFQECMFLLLCGCGTGFSVQKHHVANLPEIKSRDKGNKKFVLPDSIEGWADSVGVLMSSYFDGIVPFPEYQGYKVQFDFSNIRPAGSPVSSGSKAPGPSGLRKSLEKIEALVDRTLRHGMNKLRSIDAYDIVMHASDAVLSGGIRRSATICLFSPDDYEMATAKIGSWRLENPQRGRSNNSALLIRDDVTKEAFEELIKSVKEFGEPGFVWSDHIDLLVNPCVTSDTWVFTGDGPKQVADLIDTEFDAWVDGNLYASSDKGFFETGNKMVYEVETDEGYTVKATHNHKFQNKEEEWKALSEMSSGDTIKIHCHRNVAWGGPGKEQEGWLLGSLVGDGTFDGESALLDYWGETRYEMQDEAIECIYDNGLNTYQDIKGGDCTARVGKRRVYSVGLGRMAMGYGISSSSKEITGAIEMTSSDFTKGFLRGYFDADGSVQFNTEKGVSIRLWSTSRNNLERVQRMLLRLGMYSTIHLDRSPSGMKPLPDGHGGSKEYNCKAGHELIVSRDSVFVFHDRVGFSDRLKACALQDLVDSYKRHPYKSKFYATVKSIKEIGREDVYDCTIEEVHAFDANGMYAHNCVEIGLYGYLHLNKALREMFAEEMVIQNNTEKLSGWDFCNLAEINMKKASTEEEFYEACRAAATIGTLQAAYTDFSYLGKVSELIVEKEALLGVSMTGMADNPDIAFDARIQRKGAKIVLDVNERIAKIIGINPCARGTCVKPSGTSSLVLGTASGIHPHHAKRYFRRVQANKLETPLQYFWQFNPRAVEESVWSSNGTDVIITFLCEVPDGAKTKNQMEALALLENVKLTQQNWVLSGTRLEQCVKPWLIHNVSNTINVRPDEWGDVTNFIYRNRKWLAGISMIPMSGDKDYPQAPNTAVLTPTEIVREYGDASMFASGLIVDGLRAFNDNLWAACDCALEVGEPISIKTLKQKMERDFEHNGENWVEEGLSLETPDKLLDAWLKKNIDGFKEKTNWINRANQFAERYFDGNVRLMTYCLKDVTNWKMWCDLQREYVDVDWTKCHEDLGGNLIETDFMGEVGEACSGGACDLGELGAVMKESLEKSA